MSIAPRSSFSARRRRRVATVAAAITALCGALFATVFVWRTVEMTSGLATNPE